MEPVSNLKRLRLGRGLSLRALAAECKASAKRLHFRTHSPEHYQIVAYEHGKLLPHPRTARLLAATLNVPLPWLLGRPSIPIYLLYGFGRAAVDSRPATQ
jgi:transcriptional regulator with XRE-family HTH domain